MRWYLALLPLVAGCGSITDAASDEPEVAPAKPPSLTGTWKVVRFERWGSKSTASDVGQTWVFTAKDICRDKTPFAAYRVRRNEIDIKTTKGREIPGIYSIEGDTLNLCVNCGDARIRPEAFASMAKSGIWLIVLERVRPAGAGGHPE